MLLEVATWEKACTLVITGHFDRAAASRSVTQTTFQCFSCGLTSVCGVCASTCHSACLVGSAPAVSSAVARATHCRCGPSCRSRKSLLLLEERTLDVMRWRLWAHVALRQVPASHLADSEFWVAPLFPRVCADDALVALVVALRVFAQQPQGQGNWWTVSLELDGRAEQQTITTCEAQQLLRLGVPSRPGCYDVVVTEGADVTTRRVVSTVEASALMPMSSA